MLGGGVGEGDGEEEEGVAEGAGGGSEGGGEEGGDGQLGVVGEGEGLDGAGLGAEPALAGEVVGEGFFEEQGAGAGEEAGPALGEEVESDLFGGFMLGLGDGGLLLCGGGLELEPEEGVGGEGEGVGLVENWREVDVAEHFDGDETSIGSEVEGYGLGEAREIGDAKDGLVCAVFAF